MNKYPNLWNLEALLKSYNEVSCEIDGKWFPCRPLGFPYFTNRLRCAWEVFKGTADAVIWPGNQ